MHGSLKDKGDPFCTTRKKDSWTLANSPLKMSNPAKWCMQQKMAKRQTDRDRALFHRETNKTPISKGGGISTLQWDLLMWKNFPSLS